jgi:spore coat protein CotH
MEEILNNGLLTESEKVIKYTEAMQKFMEYQKQYTLPSVQVTPRGTTGDMGEVNSTESGENVNIIQKDFEAPDKVTKNPHESKQIDVPLAPISIKSTPKTRIKPKKREYYFSNPWLHCE